MKDGMKMPGFKAEVSLYKPRGHYNIGENRGVEGEVVIPQMVKCSQYKPENYGGSSYQCYIACMRDDDCTYDTCVKNCDKEPKPPNVHPIW